MITTSNRELVESDLGFVNGFSLSWSSPICPAFATCGVLLQSGSPCISIRRPVDFVGRSMKAMTWLKVGGCALVALAALAAADTRHLEVTRKAHWDPASRAIALGSEGCSHSEGKEVATKGGCCKKEAKEEVKHSGCCRK